MYLFESIFDLSYLVFVNVLGICLLLQKKKEAELFGAMACLLGCGDAFHLIPRIFAMWTLNGFSVFETALSFGEFVTSITMTIFYVLFYLYYKSVSNIQKGKFDWLVYGLAALRIVLSVLPQNEWGIVNGNYLWRILRNIPFTVLGILLIIRFYQARSQSGMKWMALLVALSFLFYLPVVIFSRVFPLIGFMMVPKTCAYVGIILVGFRNFMPPFNAKRLLENAFVYLIFTLVAGVFFRELTKWRSFDARTSLAFVHSHLFAIGCFGMILLMICLRTSENRSPELNEKFRKPVSLVNLGLFWTAVMMVLRGIVQVFGNNIGNASDAALSGIAGIGHILLGAGLVWTILGLLNLTTKTETAINHNG